MERIAEDDHQKNEKKRNKEMERNAINKVVAVGSDVNNTATIVTNTLFFNQFVQW